MLILEGIGNYLRAEILHRACVHPATVAHNLFQNAKKLFPTFDFEKVDEKTDKGFFWAFLFSQRRFTCSISVQGHPRRGS